VQNYQVLQDPAAATNPALTVARPYDRLPQINFHAGRYDVRAASTGRSTPSDALLAPDPASAATALVAVSAGQLSDRAPGYFITPKLMLQR
jgi:LPS-assembly protein